MTDDEPKFGFTFFYVVSLAFIVAMANTWAYWDLRSREIAAEDARRGGTLWVGTGR